MTTQFDITADSFPIQVIGKPIVATSAIRQDKEYNVFFETVDYCKDTKPKIPEKLYKELETLENIMNQPIFIIDDKTKNMQEIDSIKLVYYQIGRVLSTFRNN